MKYGTELHTKRALECGLVESADAWRGVALTNERDRHGAESAVHEFLICREIGLDVSDLEWHAGS